MQIHIHLPELHNEAGFKASIYNIVKRNQEDLLRRIPSLSEFTVTLRKTPESSIKVGNMPVTAKHQLTQNETAFAINIEFRSAFDAQKIIDVLTSELKGIKIFYD
ncbi:hypothetical protein FNO01nite_18500 [Flavobacterium noncentrifugens]|uniref:Uncharacterized protein n=1 Tax=Flavobacterium noncentrifugens TaxID=1128970 RepID=A0A1G8YEM6_9FLAO|nr:hypothetical protein [Flavobacterium noncentrifugens]GEP51178.1 hypothetical protein FNO01nite_18500 [Flavobacterium noncentrifugens]SDK00675.1 hypothetical protein SAMN04487935_2282 [Flavobacterium noncentrifugens]